MDKKELKELLNKLYHDAWATAYYSTVENHRISKAFEESCNVVKEQIISSFLYCEEEKGDVTRQDIIDKGGKIIYAKTENGTTMWLLWETPDESLYCDGHDFENGWNAEEAVLVDKYHWMYKHYLKIRGK